MQSSWTRVVIGIMSLTALAAIVYFMLIIGIIFNFSRGRPEVIDLLLGPLFVWLWPPVLLANVIWWVTVYQAFRYQTPGRNRKLWLILIACGQLLVIPVYWVIQLRHATRPLPAYATDTAIAGD